METRRRDAPYPALAAALGLHVLVIGAGLIAWPWLRPPPMPEVVPVTLVTSADKGSLANAAAAAQPTPASTEQPTPTAPPQAPAPQPQPQPVKAATPPPPQPAPKPSPAPPPPKPAPAKPEKSLDLDALAASLGATSHSSAQRQSSAMRGPNHQQTALKAQTSNGVGAVNATGASASMVAELQRLWIPDCQVKATASLNVTLVFSLDYRGVLRGGIRSSADTANNPLLTIVSERAERAVQAGSPFHDLPASDYGHQITVNFDAKRACGGG